METPQTEIRETLSKEEIIAQELKKKKLIDWQYDYERLQSMIAVQGSNGNWNYDSYMHGMLNGMIYAASIFHGFEANFRSAPDEWLADRPKFKVEDTDGWLEEGGENKLLEN